MSKKQWLFITTMGILIFFVVVGGVYFFNIWDLEVMGQPEKSKMEEVFTLKSEVKTGKNEELFNEFLFYENLQSNHNVNIAGVDKVLKEGYEINKYDIDLVDLINSRKDSLILHVPKILVDNNIIINSKGIVRFSDLFLESDMGAQGKTADKVVNYNTFKSPNVYGSLSCIIKEKDQLDNSEKNIYDQYKDKLYCQVYVKNTVYYVEIDDKDYKLINRDEFKEKAYGFEYSTDLEKLIKKSVLIPKLFVSTLWGILVVAYVVFYFMLKNEEARKKESTFFSSLFVATMVYISFLSSISLGVVTCIMAIIALLDQYRHRDDNHIRRIAAVLCLDFFTNYISRIWLG